MPGRATLTIVTSIATSSMEIDVMKRIGQARARPRRRLGAVAGRPSARSSSAAPYPHGMIRPVTERRHRRPRLTATRRDGRTGHVAGAVLRPRVRARRHPVHGADGPRPVVDRARSRASPCSPLLWWAWGGYAWLTSLIDPEEGSVRLLMFGAMAAALVASLCVPEAFGDLGLTFAVAYGVLRAAHLGLYTIGARGEPLLRRSIAGLAVGTAIGFGLLVAASFVDGWLQGVLWALALLLDVGGPFVVGVEGWQIVPEHFTERYGLFVIIALGESVVAIGVGAEARRRRRRRRRRRARRRHRRRAVVGVLRRRRHRRRRAAGRARRQAGRRTRWPATPGRTSTTR